MEATRIKQQTEKILISGPHKMNRSMDTAMVATTDTILIQEFANHNNFAGRLAPHV
jgi:hypothetical protein